MDLLRSAFYPDEIYSALKYKLGGYSVMKSKCKWDSMRPTMKKCYEYLAQTSRTFPVLIQSLSDDLRDPMCIFYLILRALDTIQDDESLPIQTRITLLKTFHQNMQDPHWCYMDCKDKDRVVLEKYPTICHEFKLLPVMTQNVMIDICRRMGEGMCKYMEHGIVTEDDWNEYCHYVSGLVGVGLVQVFHTVGAEDGSTKQELEDANKTGLFLQKSHLIRDLLEDCQDGRELWPKQVWGKYCKRLLDLSKPENKKAAVTCLNELVVQSIKFVPEVIRFLTRLKSKSAKRLCATLMVTAMASLERCYNNPDVFTRNVKIRKGETVKLIMATDSIDKIKAVFRHYILQIKDRIPQTDPKYLEAHRTCVEALTHCQTNEEYPVCRVNVPFCVSCGVIVATVTYNCLTSVM